MTMSRGAGPGRPGRGSPGTLASKILAETEYRPADRPTIKRHIPETRQAILDLGDKIEAAREILKAAVTKGKAALAYSGGADSTALLHLAAKTGIRPTMIWCDTGMEYPETQAFVEAQAEAYGLPLAIARAPREPVEQWQRTGWPMLGKMAARLWSAQHRNASFKLNVSECCRQMKIKPARDLTRNLGCAVQITGQRGRTDDRVRAMRAAIDGSLARLKQDRMWIANPLTGWTDDDVAGYAAQHGLPEHPAKARGARTIGCVYCGGGSQFENSGYRVLRRSWPAAWQIFMIDWEGGLIILALKYGIELETARAAVQELGGIRRLAEERPWIFDYTRLTPLAGYAKEARR